MRITAVVVCGLGVISCSKHDAPPPPATAVVPAAAPPTKPTAPVAAPKAAGSGSAAPATPPPPTAAELAAYTSAMARGRKATDAKAYADAIAAFDAALKARPRDPQAYAERGFARLLAGTDLDAASGDFDAAADQTRDPKLLGMIWFNRGLTDEKLHHADAALVDFYLANRFRPSAAAAAKIAGKSVCPVRVAPADAAGSGAPVPPAPIDVADWLGFTGAVGGFSVDITTDAQARAALFGGLTAPKLPAIVDVEIGMGAHTAYLVGKHGDQLRALQVGSEDGGHCAGAVDFAVISAHDDLVHVRGRETPSGGYTWQCSDPKGDVHDCTDKDDPATRTVTACDPTTPVERDVVVDLTLGRARITAEQQLPEAQYATTPIAPNDARLVQASLGSDGLHLIGLGCDQVIPLAAP